MYRGLIDMNEKALRNQLRKFVNWHEAHADWKSAVAGFAPARRGVRPRGSPHSAWELLEHARIAQRDILEFCRNPKHVSPDWPSGYWPANPAPPSAAAWNKSVKALLKDMEEMGKLAADPKMDLLKPIGHGSGQTLLRELLLAADHSSYHLGQFVLVRKMLGDWPEK
jgi:DinB superfamily